MISCGLPQRRGFDDLVRVSVRTALRRTTLRPICLHTSDKNNDLYRWLRERVEVIDHTPKWKDMLLDGARKARGAPPHLSRSQLPPRRRS